MEAMLIFGHLSSHDFRDFKLHPGLDVFAVMNKSRCGVVGNDVSTAKFGFWGQAGPDSHPSLRTPYPRTLGRLHSWTTITAKQRILGARHWFWGFRGHGLRERPCTTIAVMANFTEVWWKDDKCEQRVVHQRTSHLIPSQFFFHERKAIRKMETKSCEKSAFWQIGQGQKSKPLPGSLKNKWPKVIKNICV